jgi:hypothetical protein
MPAVNPLINAPRAPGKWVDEEKCICGAIYGDHRGDYSFAAAAQRLRHRAKDDGDEGGGYRSRGPVLWQLHVLKLESWYAEHYMCGYLAEEPDEPIPF